MTEIQKSVVQYTPTSKDWINKGTCAMIHVVHDHPVIGSVNNSQDNQGACVITSTVVSIREDGFETNNTFYKIKE